MKFQCLNNLLDVTPVSVACGVAGGVASAIPTTQADGFFQ